MITFTISISILAVTYFALLWRVTGKTNAQVTNYGSTFKALVTNMNVVTKIILAFDKRFLTLEELIQKSNARMLELENKVDLYKSDSSRLIEWLEKEEKRRNDFNVELIRSFKNEEREARIVELANRFGQVIKK